MKWNKVRTLVNHETAQAIARHTPMHSHHEAYAVIKEEFDEYWTEVTKRSSQRDSEALKLELVQTAAMCLRALHDLC